MSDTQTIKPLAALKRFFAPDMSAVEFGGLLKGFSRPLKSDPDFVWLAQESARELGFTLDLAES